jgi:zinc protease
MRKDLLTMKNLFFISSRALLLLIFAAMPNVSAQEPSPSPAQREQPPPPSEPRTVNFPVPVERTLRNGLRVVAVERRGTPLVSAQMWIRTGGEADPADLPGLAEMTADLVTNGTARRTAPQIAEEIESLGGEIESGARWDRSFVTVGVTRSRLARAMDVLADVVRRPAFQAEEIERVRQQTIDYLNVALEQPGTIARLVASRAVFGDTPYGHPLIGTRESIARARRDDIVRFHRLHYRPDNAVLVIGGGIAPAEAFQLAERFFGDWRAPNMPLSATRSPNGAPLPTRALDGNRSGNQNSGSANGGVRVVVVDMPTADQTAVVVARQGITRSDPDFYRGIVANSVFGGGYSSRLNQEVRIRRGLSYGAFSSLDARRMTGPFVAATQTKNDTGDEVAALMIDELNRLATGALEDSELTPRRAALAGAFARELETVEGLVDNVAMLALYGLNLDETNRFIGNVQRVTSSDVRAFARAKLGTDGARVVVVGRASEFLDSLRQRFPNLEVIPIAQLDFNSARLRRAASTPTSR